MQRFLAGGVLIIPIVENACNQQHQGERRRAPLDHLLAMAGDEFDGVLYFQSELVALHFFAGELISHGDLVTAGNLILTCGGPALAHTQLSRPRRGDHRVYAKLRTAEASSSNTSKTVYSLVICNRSFTRLVKLSSLSCPPWFVTVVKLDTISPIPELSM